MYTRYVYACYDLTKLQLVTCTKELEFHYIPQPQRPWPMPMGSYVEKKLKVNPSQHNWYHWKGLEHTFQMIPRSPLCDKY